MRRVDILFANAGLGVFAPIDQIDEAAYDKQFDINVKGAYFTIQKLLPLLNEGSSVILTASAVREKGVPTGSLHGQSQQSPVPPCPKTRRTPPKRIDLDLDPGLLRLPHGR